MSLSNMYSSVAASAFTVLHHHDLCLVPKHFLTQKETRTHVTATPQPKPFDQSHLKIQSLV